MSTSKRLPGKFVWFEHESPDPRRAQAFYGELFGWRMQPFAMPDGAYDMIYVGDEMVGGYVRKEGAASSRWMSCVSVDDVDTAARAAATNGGRVLAGPMSIPNAGRMARIADPQGAEIYLFTRAAGDPPDARATNGRWLWNELHTTDASAALAFYGEVVGFTHKAMEMRGGPAYHVLSSKDGQGRGGVSTQLAPDASPHWQPYVYVDDADATVGRARLLGATVPMPPFDIPGVGRVAVLQDPTGATLAMLQPAPGT